YLSECGTPLVDPIGRTSGSAVVPMLSTRRRTKSAPAGRTIRVGSEAGALRGGSPQPRHVAHRRRAKEPPVLAAEVRGVVIPDAVAGAGGVDVLAEHEAAGFLEPQLLLELEGAHRGDRLEVVVEAGDAHPELTCQVLDPERPVEVSPEPRDGL